MSRGPETGGLLLPRDPHRTLALGPGPATRIYAPPYLQPAVTYANVGELALDVLVTSLAPVTPLGPLESANCLPVVGNDAFDAVDGNTTGVLTTALELFSIPGQIHHQKGSKPLVKRCCAVRQRAAARSSYASPGSEASIMGGRSH